MVFYVDINADICVKTMPRRSASYRGFKIPANAKNMSPNGTLLLSSDIIHGAQSPSPQCSAQSREKDMLHSPAGQNVVRKKSAPFTHGSHGIHEGRKRLATSEMESLPSPLCKKREEKQATV